MTRRNHLEWHLLGEGSDPVPADGWDVRQVAKQFADRGSVMSSAATTLEKFATTDDWTGDAAKKFAEKAAEAHSDLGKAADKYVDAGTALYTFADAVDDARTETAAAVADAVDADNRRRSNSSSLLDGVDDPSEDLQDADDRRQDRLDGANSDLTAARTRLRNAMDALDAAADTCKRAINAASGHFKDSTMDDVKGAVSAVLKVLVDALTIIAIIIAVVLIVLVIIGSGGTALAAFLTAAAFWVGLSILALTSVQYFMGDASLEDVGWAALGAIGGGLTKFVGAGAKAIVGTTRLQVLTRVADQARRSLPFYVKFAQRIPIGFVSRWAQGRELAAVTAAVTRAASVIDDAAVRSPLITRALGVVGLDDVVNNFLRIRAMSTLGLEAAETTALTTATLRNVAGLGAAGMSGVAQAHDFSEILDAVTSFPDTLHDSDIAILDAADGVPERDMPLPDPTRVTPVGR